MKKLLILLLVILAPLARADYKIVATITITNAPNTNGSSFEWNSDVRTGTNANSSTTYATNTSIGGITTNFWRHVIKYPFGNQHYAEWIATNSIKIYAENNTTVTNVLVGDYFSVSLATNTIGGMRTNVAVPAINAYSQSDATNVLTQLVDDINNYSSSPITNLGSVIYATEIGATILNINGFKIDAGGESFLFYDPSTNLIFTANSAGITVAEVDATSAYVAGGASLHNIATPRTNHTTLANGNNSSLNFADRTYAKLSGPSAAFAICSITNGTDGRLLILQNSTGFTMTIANESGADGTVANRIYTGTAGDVAITNNPGIAKFIYDDDSDRWIFLGSN